MLGGASFAAFKRLCKKTPTESNRMLDSNVGAAPMLPRLLSQPLEARFRLLLHEETQPTPPRAMRVDPRQPLCGPHGGF